MEKYLLAFIASYLFVFLKSFQQLNVVHNNYWWVVPTSILMATCEVYVIYNAAHMGWGWLVLWVGVGSGLGAVSSMFIHNLLRKKKT